MMVVPCPLFPLPPLASLSPVSLSALTAGSAENSTASPPARCGWQNQASASRPPSSRAPTSAQAARTAPWATWGGTSKTAESCWWEGGGEVWFVCVCLEASEVSPPLSFLAPCPPPSGGARPRGRRRPWRERKKKGWGVKGGGAGRRYESLSLSSLLYLPVSGVYVGASRACGSVACVCV